jgi:hypothetical protein
VPALPRQIWRPRLTAARQREIAALRTHLLSVTSTSGLPWDEICLAARVVWYSGSPMDLDLLDRCHQADGRSRLPDRDALQGPRPQPCLPVSDNDRLTIALDTPDLAHYATPNLRFRIGPYPVRRKCVRGGNSAEPLSDLAWVQPLQLSPSGLISTAGHTILPQRQTPSTPTSCATPAITGLLRLLKQAQLNLLAGLAFRRAGGTEAYCWFWGVRSDPHRQERPSSPNVGELMA